MARFFKYSFYPVALALVTALCAPSGAEMVDKVIVVVNDEVVTQREFDRAFDPIKKTYEDNFKGEELQRRLEQAREGLMEQLINSKLAISLAKKEKVEIDEQELTERIGTIKSYYGSEPEFLQALSARGTNLTEFEKEIKDQMLAQKLVEKEVTSKIVVSPAEIKDLYQKNQEKLVAPEQVKVRGIMVRKTGDEEEDAQKKKKIEGISKELEKGKDFGTVATESSEGPYAKNGGDMGYISRGQTLEEIDEAIFSIDKGNKSDIVETNIGYHIFLVEDKMDTRPLEYAEVADFLKQQLYMKKFEEELMKWLEEKRKNAYISFK